MRFYENSIIIVLQSGYKKKSINWQILVIVRGEELEPIQEELITCQKLTILYNTYHNLRFVLLLTYLKESEDNKDKLFKKSHLDNLIICTLSLLFASHCQNFFEFWLLFRIKIIAG